MPHRITVMYIFIIWFYSYIQEFERKWFNVLKTLFSIIRNLAAYRLNALFGN